MTNYEKLINTLKEVFMLDKAELDFGIYRIMNQKRKDIEQFLEVDLVPQVQKVLSESLSVDKQALQKELDDAIKSAQALGADPNTLPKVQDLKKRLGEAADMVGIENEVFSLLANFFKRYFDNGDFISMRRYKKDVYAIPYEGEEVKLHWANADQYYIKTSEYFKVYRFKLANGKTVAFELIEASTEQNNNKTQGDKERRFALANEELIIKNDELVIPFTYEQTDKKVTQKDLLADALEKLLPQIQANFPDFTDLLSLRPTEKDKQRTLLQKHLLDYTARNTFDYFIHKDLGGFLTRELDFYIKNEVLFIDDLNTRDEQEFLKQLSKIKAIKKIGEKIITFLAQLENFQKKLWLKKKMVVECNYCITLDRVPTFLYPEIIKNEELKIKNGDTNTQTNEWIKLFAIDEIKAQESGGLFPENKVGFSNPLTLDFLNQNQFLVLDTAFFSETFKWKLITSIEKFDEQCDGLLINSENFQALAMLQTKYYEKVTTNYIDPPYNTDGDGFIYKDSFQHSTWLSLMTDRLALSKNLLFNEANVFVSIDNREQERLKILLQNVFNEDNFVETFLWTKTSTPPALSNKSRKTVEYIHCFEKNLNSLEYTGELLDNGDAPFLNSGNAEKEIIFPPNSIRFNIPDGTYKPGRPDKVEIISECIVKNGTNQNEVVLKGSFKWQQSTVTSEILNGTYFLVKTERFSIRFQRKDVGGFKAPNNKLVLELNKEIDVDTNEGAFKEISNLGIDGFSFPKPSSLISKLIYFNSALKADKLILDYFAGSGTTGHAVINLNREDQAKRKYILVEMGTYFDTVTKPRIKKAVYSKDWKDGKPVSREGISHCFKCMRLESYEDTLNNLALKQTDTQQKALEMNPTFKEGYMLNYMLDVEAQDSLLNLEWFVNPFNCFLNITKNNELQPTKVDLVETFNYLIGLVVESYAVPKDGYVVVTGKNLAEESILVVWRDCTQHNSTALNQFLEKSKYNPLDSEYERIYVNGDNNVENLKTGDERWKVILIEEEFGKRMFENV